MSWLRRKYISGKLWRSKKLIFWQENWRSQAYQLKEEYPKVTPALTITLRDVFTVTTPRHSSSRGGPSKEMGRRSTQYFRRRWSRWGESAG